MHGISKRTDWYFNGPFSSIKLSNYLYNPSKMPQNLISEQTQLLKRMKELRKKKRKSDKTLLRPNLDFLKFQLQMKSNCIAMGILVNYLSAHGYQYYRFKFGYGFFCCSI